jgi:hypothetical protein
MRSWLACAVILVPGMVYASPLVGWIRATGQLEAEAPARYTPLHLLDAVSSTVWCTRGADALSEVVSFGFAEPVKITRLLVTTGNDTSEESFHAFSRARKLLLRSGETSVTFSVEDRREPQAVPIEPPLSGRSFTLEVLDGFTAEDPLAAMCLADVVPYAGLTALAGPPLRKSLGFQPARAELLGPWYSGPDGAPDRSLTFFLDGTWRYAPEGAGKVKPLSGKWGVSSGQVWLTVPGPGKVEARPKVNRRPDAAGAGKAKPFATLTFDGSVGELKQSFRDRR